MDVLVILLFISLVFVLGALTFFLRAVGSGDIEQGDRISLLPLDGDGEISSEDRSRKSNQSNVPSMSAVPSMSGGSSMSTVPSESGESSSLSQSREKPAEPAPTAPSSFEAGV